LNGLDHHIPDVLLTALKINPAAAAVLMQMPPSHQKEYFRYIKEAKKKETQVKRVEKTIEMLLQKAR
jgi:uncharacterized protein YdeI (YjbR/CyaY-like superfamily)